MNSRSVQRVSYNIRAPLTFPLSCHSFDCYDCFVFIVSSPLSYCSVGRRPRPVPLCSSASSATVPLLSSYQASRAIPLSHISPTFLYLSVALGICCCYVTFLFKCIACLCRPLMYLSFILLQPI